MGDFASGEVTGVAAVGDRTGSVAAATDGSLSFSSFSSSSSLQPASQFSVCRGPAPASITGTSRDGMTGCSFPGVFTRLRRAPT